MSPEPDAAKAEAYLASSINWPCLRLKKMLPSGRRAQRICGLGLSPNLAPPLTCFPPFQLGYEMPQFSPTPWALEIRPIIGVRNNEAY